MKIPEDRIIEAKTALSRAILPETFLVSLYRVLAPYRGCAHGCRYCDGRAEKYYVEGDFERDIAVRTNLPELVARDIASGLASRERGAFAIGSGVTDAYQPLERELGLTRRTLEALIPSRLPVVILTKNDLVLRDFDILTQFPRALVIVTITTVNPAHAAILEPGASTPAERLEIVRRAKEAGFFSGIMAMPFCPGISDGDDSLNALLSAAERVGADFVYPGGLTLRPGRQKDLFLGIIDEQFPNLRPLYDELYRENRQSGMPLVQRSAPRAREWDALVRGRGMPQMIPHRVYRELLSPPDAFFVLLCHMENLYAIRGVDTKPLRLATGRYVAWLKEARTTLRRKRVTVAPSDPFPITRILDEKFAELCACAIGETDAVPPGLARVLGNDRLAALAAAISGSDTAAGPFFDYPTLGVSRIGEPSSIPPKRSSL